MAKVFCGKCEYYDPITFLITKGERNVSGGLVIYRRWLNSCRNEHELNEDCLCPYYKPNEVKCLHKEKFDHMKFKQRHANSTFYVTC